ncbi:MAG: peptidylprolyl isomerase [Thermodesulfovibrionales bacterium]|nr:peptidylprolyl isomerase [Thermodesulfovibrionales bacterium]
MKRFAVLFIAVMLLFSCTKKDAGQEKKAAGGDYMVKIGDAALSKDDIDREIKAMPEEAQRMLFGDKAVFEKFLQDYAEKEMLYKDALKKGVDKDKDFVKRMEYSKKIATIQFMLNKELSKKAEVTDTDIQEYYNKNKADFKKPASYKLSHILVKTEDAAKKAAERIKKGEDFAKVAKEISEDKESAKSGGDIGDFEKGKLPPEFDKAVQNMKKGQISAPIKTQFGYHIIKVADIKPESYIDLNNLKENLRSVLAREKQQKVLEEYVKGLKQTYKVEINKAEVDKYLASMTKDNKTDAAKPADGQKQEKAK